MGRTSNTLLVDGAIGLEAFLMQLFAREIAWCEDYAFLRGNGVGKPLGAIMWAGLISVARSAASAFSLADYAGVFARWISNHDQSSVCWACHPAVLDLASVCSTGVANARKRESIEPTSSQPTHARF